MKTSDLKRVKALMIAYENVVKWDNNNVPYLSGLPDDIKTTAVNFIKSEIEGKLVDLGMECDGPIDF